MNPRRPEMADIIRTHQADLQARWNHVLSREQRKALGNIRDCRSAALGGRVQHAFESLCDQAASIDWVVHVKPPFGGPRRVLKYLARYTHRVAISNHRLRSLENGRVSFDWKDYADHSRTKTMSLEAVEFLRRFLLHVLPTGLVRIRQFGFLANRVRKHKLERCRTLLAARSPVIPGDPESAAVHADPQPCPICKLGRLRLLEVLSAALTPIPDTS